MRIEPGGKRLGRVMKLAREPGCDLVVVEGVVCNCIRQRIHISRVKRVIPSEIVAVTTREAIAHDSVRDM